MNPTTLRGRAVHLYDPQAKNQPWMSGDFDTYMRHVPQNSQVRGKNRFLDAPLHTPFLMGR
jgi:hypothetical protein